MTLTDEYIEAQQADLQGRVQAAAAGAAQAIGSEAADTPNHAARISLATQVGRSPQMFTNAFTQMLTAQGITRQSTDADITGMVSAVWNTMAGTSTPLPPPAP